MLKLVTRLFTRLNPPRQIIKFSYSVTIGTNTFEPNRYYSFKVVWLGQTRWLIYRGNRLMTLDCFANMFVDQNYAQWVDDDSQVAA